MSVVFSTLAFIFLICVLVTIHELGHLIVARANGVFAEIFSIGFGPVLCEKTDKYGTKWRLSLIPAGGYVKMFGDADATSVKESMPSGYTEDDMNKMSLHRKKPWQKLLVAVAGPVFNLVFAVVVLVCLGLIRGVPVHTSAISVVDEASLAYISGLRNGDIVVKANGADISDFDVLREQITLSAGKELILEVKRRDKTENITIKMYKEEDNKIVPVNVIGIMPGETLYKKTSLINTITSSVYTTYFLAVNNISAILKIITNKASTKNVGGIISIFKIASKSAEAGFTSFFWMMAVLSTILGAINLLPIPVLDGGTVVISAIEWIFGRPLNKKLIETIFMIGFVIIAGLMLLGIWNDLSNCKFFVWLENLFK
ncbi:MAG: M50 family metallopeptidase [Holosporales bacterium]|jgi:regulator of sigma E protease|nr:M50 family metallopeptidase [Holosporales bacterium]